MTSLLQPGYTLNLGSQQWTQQLLQIDLKLEAAPLLDILTVRLPAAAPLSASIGDAVELTLNSGEKEAKVFTGVIDAIRHGFGEMRVSALNAGAELARFRPAATYEQITAGNVLRALCGDAGVDTGEVDDGISLAFYAADPSRSALEHVARVCGWSGAMARISNENRVESAVVNATQPDVALKYGREILDTCQWKLMSKIESFVVVGESGTGSTSAPEALRATTDFFGGSPPNGPSPKSRWASEPALRTVSGARTAGAALQRAYNSSRENGRMEAFLQPDLRPGSILQIRDLPDGLPSGPLWLYRVQHWIRRNGAGTRAHFYKGGDAFDPMALLGSLAGAIGSLL
jgi:hypothetical protein